MRGWPTYKFRTNLAAFLCGIAKRGLSVPTNDGLLAHENLFVGAKSLSKEKCAMTVRIFFISVRNCAKKTGECVALPELQSRYAFAMSACLAVVATTVGASAVTVEVAKKCNALTVEAYPPFEPGNPAAGSAKGDASSVRHYFNECLAKGGEVEKPATGEPPRPSDIPK